MNTRQRLAREEQEKIRDMEYQNEYKVRQLSWEEIKHLYNTNMQQDFPAQEIKPFDMMEDLHRKGLNQSYDLWEENETELSAYAIFERAHQGNVWLLDYFAVDRKKRGTGLGSIFLDQMRDILKDVDAVFLEIERIEKAEDEKQRLVRERRKNFYLQNGLAETNVFTVADGGMDYEILCLPVQKEIVGQAAGKKMRQIYETFFEAGTYEIYVEG